jgi:branched-chain amino acid transport system ATP-binding protein
LPNPPESPSPPFRGERENLEASYGTETGSLLEFRAVDTHYGDLHVLKSVDYRIAAGEIVCLLGGNASGKSTTMKAIMGSVAPSRGDILYEGHSLRGVSTAERVRRGIAPVLEARRLFPRMTVYENLDGRLYAAPRARVR